jgi:hypothetical protein
MVETVLVTPILLLLLLGLIESGHGLSIKHKMATLSREGANIAARGTTLQQTLDVVMGGGDEIGLSENGGAIITRVIVKNGDPVIDAQLAFGGFENASRLGLADSVAVALQSLSLIEGQVFHAVEILYDYESITPVGNFLPAGWTDEVYERAIF